MRFGPYEPVLIVSRDKDYPQLMMHGDVHIHCPDKNRIVAKPKDILSDLLDHVLKGDQVDGIPNVLSDDNTFITEGVRSVPMTAARKKYMRDVPVQDWDSPTVLTELLKVKPKQLDETVKLFAQAKENMERNQKLIDLRLVPEEIMEAILDKYNEPVVRGPRGMFDYFYKYNMPRLLDRVSYF